MKFSDLIETSASSLTRNKSRAFLTILGIVIGISSVILMLSIGRSAEGLILNQVADLGADLVFAEPSSGTATSGPPDPFVEQTIDLKDYKAWVNSGIFSAVDAGIYITTTVTFEQESQFSQIAGVTDQYLNIFPANVALGSFITKTDFESGAKVAVLGSEIAKDLFGDRNPVGQRIRIKNTPYRVIGVMADQGTRFFQNLDMQVALPVTSVQRDLVGDTYVNYLTGRAKDGNIEYTKDEARWLLRDSHNLDNPAGDTAKDDFLVSSQSDAVEIIGVVGNVLSILLASIAAISLVVGGIGIMNIMLVSVTERTKEIGLRKSVGATYKEILVQFLFEAVLLTMIGGIIGVLLGAVLSLGGGYVASKYVDGWMATIPLTAVLMGVGVATIVGVVFGLYPAQRAAKLEPVDALRYE
ncbi:hypothetical protein COY25_00150 [Candidatus Uhrbacteria bacterium CG_4_10_14_0_2_um_filter_41_7]|uniref:Multidrug ABC transporter substrate-binding protein n=1 Tax=Candidatus Uhrbacteria bacterium CG_4_9_14_3_um_filter_41_35 TaxID=1975034 RepID=A0A2M7XFZ3_9BACT|nr:MAG: hypothetical protein COV92_03870 [Candidatus Uhrbacteria bacterium CG11_big_fil_rev_8_21_14_0_20_41_9]PIZ55833.1 MAG: hypothetical protein COY25_00150 [Candidatus Uhrbacteria bacterium CG_4_10_14_0_2_um_filter_41_7]PJA46810.1 MAG: hypothetical protein CO173_01130 [Candidatus Uhrbacteria bacterium CG_4_9_14_3_um_filter_41_35]